MHTRKNFIRAVIVISLGVLLFAAVSLAAVKSHLRWTGHYYFGTITAITDTGFRMQEGGGVGRAVLVNPETIIKKGRETIRQGLAKEGDVVVIGSPDAEGMIEARIIRVVGEHRRGKKP